MTWYFDDRGLLLARTAREVDPKLVAAYESGKLRYRGQRGTQKAPTKERVSIRLSREVLTYFKSMGDGWQTRIDRALTSFVEAAKYMNLQGFFEL